MSVAEGPIQPDRLCPYSGLPILRCKRSDLCDCFDFPEHDRELLLADAGLFKEDT